MADSAGRGELEEWEKGETETERNRNRERIPMTSEGISECINQGGHIWNSQRYREKKKKKNNLTVKKRGLSWKIDEDRGNKCA